MQMSSIIVAVAFIACAYLTCANAAATANATTAAPPTVNPDATLIALIKKEYGNVSTKCSTQALDCFKTNAANITLTDKNACDLVKVDPIKSCLSPSGCNAKEMTDMEESACAFAPQIAASVLMVMALSYVSKLFGQQ